MPTKKGTLTLKEAKLVKAKAKGMTNADAYSAAGYAMPANKQSASINASKVLARPNVQEVLQAALERHNLTPDRVASVVSEGMDAEKFNEFTGEIRADHSTRLKAAGMAAKFMKLEGTEEKPTTHVWVRGDATFNANKYMED